MGVGASAEDIFKNYQPVGVNSTKTGYRVNGVNFTEGGYHPYLQFTVDGDQKINSVELSNYLIDPDKTK